MTEEVKVEIMPAPTEEPTELLPKPKTIEQVIDLTFFIQKLAYAQLNCYDVGKRGKIINKRKIPELEETIRFLIEHSYDAFAVSTRLYDESYETNFRRVASDLLCHAHDNKRKYGIEPRDLGHLIYYCKKARELETLPLP